MDVILAEVMKRGSVDKMDVQIEEHFLSNSNSNELSAEATTVQKSVKRVV